MAQSSPPQSPPGQPSPSIQTNQPDQAPPPKRWPRWLCLLIGIVVVLAVGIFLLLFFSPTSRFERAFARGDFEQAYAIQRQSATGSLWRYERELVDAYLKETLEACQQGTISLDEANERVEAIEPFFSRGWDYDCEQAETVLQQISEDRAALIEADGLKKAARYLEALEVYREISSQDPNTYEKSRQGIAEISDILNQEALDKAEGLVEEGRFLDAWYALDEIPNSVRQESSTLRKQEIQKNAQQEVIRQAEEVLENGDPNGAFLALNQHPAYLFETSVRQEMETKICRVFISMADEKLAAGDLLGAYLELTQVPLELNSQEITDKRLDLFYELDNYLLTESEKRISAGDLHGAVDLVYNLPEDMPILPSLREIRTEVSALYVDDLRGQVEQQLANGDTTGAAATLRDANVLAVQDDLYRTNPENSENPDILWDWCRLEMLKPTFVYEDAGDNAYWLSIASDTPKKYHIDDTRHTEPRLLLFNNIPIFLLITGFQDSEPFYFDRITFDFGREQETWYPPLSDINVLVTEDDEFLHYLPVVHLFDSSELFWQDLYSLMSEIEKNEDVRIKFYGLQETKSYRLSETELEQLRNGWELFNLLLEHQWLTPVLLDGMAPRP
ncbi:MAG TPA: hypothetical protein H9671_04055 [Firmicutes bacterium]|nr:hypothetical protein [Bacillota bacterium]